MRVVGLDVGINSIGFAYVDLSTQSILEMGSRLFEAAEHPKTGASLAVPRREARGQRRRLYRKRRKVARLRSLLKAHDLKVEKCLSLSNDDLSPWQLRKQALGRKLTDREFARTLIHFAKRPGFESNRKSAPSNDEGPLITGSKELYEQMRANDFQTIGSYLASLPKQRNDPESYGRTVLREDLKAELSLIFQKQRGFGNHKATNELLEKVKDTAFHRLPLRSSLALVGGCSLEPDEKRAPKKAYHAELFVTLSRLTSLKIEGKGGEKRFLTPGEISLLEEKAHSTAKVTFTQARKYLGLGDNETFNLATYRKIKDGDNTWEAVLAQAEKATLIELNGFHTLRKALTSLSKMDWEALVHSPDDLDTIAYALSFFEAEDQIREQLSSLNLTDEQVIALLKVTGFSKTIDLSIKATKKLIPHLREGKNYGEIVRSVYPDFGKHTGQLDFLPPLKESTRNPVVDRAISQIRKVVNALIRKHGMPDHFHIETARELGNSWKIRKNIERDNKKRQAFKEETRKHAMEILGYEPNGDELAKFRLWKEQSGFCVYSGVEIKPIDLRDGTQTQIDHILPYSRSFDDSWSNKVLCFASENQAKKNETAWEYMDRKGRLAGLEDFARTQDIHRSKKLLLQDFNDEKAKEWKSRHLNDTRYVSRALSGYLEENLKPNEGIKQLVRTRKGGLTSKLRHLWGLPDKDRENDHRHHGIDALVIACSTQSMVQRVARWNRYQRGTRNDPGFFAEQPWPDFRKDALEKLDHMFVTRQPARKTGGRLHKDTIMRLKENGEGAWQAIKRVKVLDLKLSDLNNLVGVEIKDGVVTGRNAALYAVLKDRLEAYGGDGKKAFSQPIYMPTGPNAKERPQIRRVRLYDNTKSGFQVRKGFADNAEMAWTEVYEKEGKFYLLPIYTHQVATKNWPDRLIFQGKDEKDWPQVDDTYRYKFALFKNDYVVLETKKGQVREGYYKGTHRGVGTIHLEEHQGASTDNPGVKTMKSFKKYHIDLFGERSEVKEKVPWRGER